MVSEDKDLIAANEIGKIYHSFLDKKILCDFFVENTLLFINADRGFLYLTGAEDKLWLDACSDQEPAPSDLQAQAEAAFKKGQNVNAGGSLFIPLIVRNNAIGIACFTKNSPGTFNPREATLAESLATQLGGALKNILLHEQNIKMERLAAIGRTTSMVIHEMKNIMQIGMFSQEWIQEGLKNNNQKFLERGAKGITKALREMNGFIYEMLSLTKDYHIQPQPLNLQALLEELAEDLKPKAEQNNVKLDFSLETEGLEAEGEDRSIYRALLNIVKNAVEASDKPDAYIRIKIRETDAGHYQIKIEDNGMGMTDEVKANIFQAFFSTKGEKGTGLGLMIIDRTVKAHQGKIEVDSTFGKGTAFTLTFPKKIAVNPSDKKS